MATNPLGQSDLAGPARPGKAALGTAMGGSGSRTWPAYVAAALGFASAAVSCYWALGGMWGLSSLGGRLEELARARDPALIRIVWVVVVVKVIAGAVALALVRSWGQRLPRRLLLIAAWFGAVVLTGWGTLQELAVGLIAADVTTPAQRPGVVVLVGRLLFWEPWFVVWGVSLGFAARLAQGRPRSPGRLAVSHVASDIGRTTA